MLSLYTSDSHLNHLNVIEFSKRPFKDVAHMNALLVGELRLAEQRVLGVGGRLVHCGDLCFNYAKFIEDHGPIFQTSVGKIIKCGNHDEIHSPRNNKTRDKRQIAAYMRDFEQVVGTIGGWEQEGIVLQDELDGKLVTVLVSHAPIAHMWGCDANLHGHLHNDVLLKTPHRDGFEWSFESPTHFNVGVELHDFKPVTLQEAADAHRSGYAAARRALAERGVEGLRENSNVA